MRPYEVMIILDAGLEEDSIRAVLGRATETLQNAGGTVNRVDHIGKARLAYEIKHRSEGYYVLIEASAEPTAVSEVDRVLSLADEVVRHKVIRVPESAAGKGARPILATESAPVAAVATAEPSGE
jgi:small subunit ribosomal protein S6